MLWKFYVREGDQHQSSKSVWMVLWQTSVITLAQSRMLRVERQHGECREQ